MRLCFFSPARSPARPPAFIASASRPPLRLHRYKPVDPSTFGLSVDDILRLDDKSLNQVVGIKRLAPYREDATKLRPNYKALQMVTADAGEARGKVQEAGGTWDAVKPRSGISCRDGEDAATYGIAGGSVHDLSSC